MTCTRPLLSAHCERSWQCAAAIGAHSTELAVHGGLHTSHRRRERPARADYRRRVCGLLSSVSELVPWNAAPESPRKCWSSPTVGDLLFDLETGQRGFVIADGPVPTAWREAQVALPAQASDLERLVADDPEQQATGRPDRSGRHRRMQVSIPLVRARRKVQAAAKCAATDEGAGGLMPISTELIIR